MSLRGCRGYGGRLCRRLGHGRARQRDGSPSPRPSGELLATGRASRHRPDLASLGLGRTTLAFRIPVALGTAPQRLHVYADGEELPGSPIITGPGRFDLHCTLEGGDDQRLGHRARARFHAPDISVIDQHGRELAAAPRARRQHRPIRSSPRRASSSNWMMAVSGLSACSMCKSPAARSPPCRATSRSPAISRRSRPKAVSGWLISPEAPGRRFSLDIRRDGKTLAQVRCEHAREDVRARFPGCTTPGFSAHLRPLPAGMQSCTISLHLAGERREIFDGPYLVASRAAAVSRRASPRQPVPRSSLPDAERAVLQQALQDFLLKARQQDQLIVPRIARAATRRTW